MTPSYCVTLKDVQEAQRRIQGFVHTTPVMTCSSLDALAVRKLFFKCELLQKTGSFKIRGAINAVKSLPPDKCTAVVTHSSGNHGQALALAAQIMGIPAHVVVPSTAAACKKSAILGYGALVVDCEPTDKSRAEVAANTVQKTGGVLIHPNQDPAVIAGQGTIGFEILQQVPGLEALVIPVGGGGMLAGIAVAVKRERWLEANAEAEEQGRMTRCSERLLLLLFILLSHTERSAEEASCNSLRESRQDKYLIQIRKGGNVMEKTWFSITKIPLVWLPAKKELVIHSLFWQKKLPLITSMNET
ncbi:serine racemase isoform X2 [Phyllobates terribilis]|uniref:serine racemase isoform X2 n=1 Tax=Phyllobates terribilis TaxID=111132 RepID=UPI003CCA6F8A